jgi:hypothetical protein
MKEIFKLEVRGLDPFLLVIFKIFLPLIPGLVIQRPMPAVNSAIAVHPKMYPTGFT